MNKFAKVQEAIREIEVYLNHWENGKRPKEHRHLCFALDHLQSIEPDDADRDDSEYPYK